MYALEALGRRRVQNLNHQLNSIESGHEKYIRPGK